MFCAQLSWGEEAHSGGPGLLTAVLLRGGVVRLLEREEPDPQVRPSRSAPDQAGPELFGTMAHLLSAPLRAPRRALDHKGRWRSHSRDLYVCSPSGWKTGKSTFSVGRGLGIKGCGFH